MPTLRLILSTLQFEFGLELSHNICRSLSYLQNDINIKLIRSKSYRQNTKDAKFGKFSKNSLN